MNSVCVCGVENIMFVLNFHNNNEDFKGHTLRLEDI